MEEEGTKVCSYLPKNSINIRRMSLADSEVFIVDGVKRGLQLGNVNCKKENRNNKHEVMNKHEY